MMQTTVGPGRVSMGSSIRRLVRRWGPEFLLIPLVVVSIIGLWAWIVDALNVRSVILPNPAGVWRALVRGLTQPLDSRGGYYFHTLVFLREAFGGFALGSALGLFLALLLSQIRLLERVFKPLIVAFQSVPKIAVAPLFIIWFGFGSGSKVALTTLVVFFPVLVAGLTGFQAVERERLEVMRSLGASRWQTFKKLVMPGSLPYLFAGLEISLVHALTATIVMEFLAGRAGLGVLIVQMGQVLDTAGIFSVLVVLGAIGWLLVGLLGLLRRRLVFWTDVDTGPGTK